ncbi:hypothetical protein, partial [Zymomonas sp.]|uniref:hypothetical protein n=1 Tax=Zymomonas sp. TaxID=2068624 RepID=UPI0025E7B1E4
MQKAFVLFTRAEKSLFSVPIPIFFIFRMKNNISLGISVHLGERLFFHDKTNNCNNIFDAI